MSRLKIVVRKRGEVVLNDGTRVYRCERSMVGECSYKPDNHWVCWTPTTQHSPAYPTMRDALRAAGMDVKD